MLVERILEEVFPDETGAARLQQVGLFTLILMLEGDEGPVTETRLADLSGQDRSAVNRQLQKLLKVDLIERTAVLAPHGRGRAWHLSIKHTPQTKRLVEALSGGARKS
jgi:predicted transcriptional regulator